MMEWLLNDIITLELWDDIRMSMEWLLNDGMTSDSEWQLNDKSNRSPCLPIIQGMTFEWENDKWSRSPCLPIIRGMTLEWENDNWMTNQVDPLASLLYEQWL